MPRFPYRTARRAPLALLLFLPVTAAAAPPVPDSADDPRYGLLTPLPDRGGVPPIVDLLRGPSPAELAHRARVREYDRQIRQIVREHLGRMRVPERREAGIRQLREFTDPAAFQSLVEVTAHEKDDVRLAVLDHLAAQGEQGQAALAWTAIHHEDDAIRHEAMRRMTTPASMPVLRVLDQALRSRTHRVANNAGWLSGALGALETIPLLIFAQETNDPEPAEKGDLAWIAIETQRAFVADLQAVVGDGSAAFVPVTGVVSEGIVLRVMDAVVIVLRTEVHLALVTMTSRDWGESTAHLGYDMRAWWEWYNTEYVPFRNERARRQALEQDRDDPEQG